MDSPANQRSAFPEVNGDDRQQAEITAKKTDANRLSDSRRE